MERELKDKIVVITGGACGIGFSIAEKYLQNQVAAVIILDTQQEKGEKSTNILNEKYGDKAIFKKCDVTTDLDLIYCEIIDAYKYVDILINNAGISERDNPRLTMNVNALAPIEWTLKFRKHMSKENGGKGGTILNMGSLFGIRSSYFGPVYQASKHALNGFTKAIGHQFNFDNSGVRVIALCPGFTTTSLVKKYLDEDAEKNIPSHILEFVRSMKFQSVDAVSNAAVDIFVKAETGTIWVIENNVLLQHEYEM
ncbi:15-hydroxyprostaglandin dehydrogenase [NAD(+)]-like [Bombyx mandarina]|uniref:15-hydroxyprostaglandin dehydrogenase [NAD(+)]-like n=1 Tax=Bombyx mandarina TaxID=7092 RepID=A0A6J2K9L1_BOMMA|nr:15-hydroxyprostaglandin dehydrogenase [NAD(+)]-like [Bombyx mandarina]